MESASHYSIVRKLSLSVVFLTCIFNCSLTRADGDAAPISTSNLDAVLGIQKVDYPSSGVKLGQGWDGVLSQKVGDDCVKGESFRSEEITTNFNFREIKDREEIFRSLSISSGGKISVPGVGSAKSSTSFTKSVEIKSSKLNLLASISQIRGGEFLVPQNSNLVKDQADEKKWLQNAEFGSIEIAPAALKVLREKGLSAFTQMCGTHFVAAIERGADLHALLSSTFNSRDDRTTLSHSVSGSMSLGGLVDAGGDAKFVAVFNKFLSTDDFKIEYLQRGGKVDEIPTTYEQLKERLTKFPSGADFREVPFSVYIMSYKTLAQWPPSYTIQQPSLLDSWLNQYWRMNDLSEDYEAVLMKKTEFYFGMVGAELNPYQELIARHDNLRRIQSNLQEIIFQCYKKRICVETSAVKLAMENYINSDSEQEQILPRPSVLVNQYALNDSALEAEHIQTLAKRENELVQTIGADMARNFVGPEIDAIECAEEMDRRANILSLYDPRQADTLSPKKGGGVKMFGYMPQSTCNSELKNFARLVDSELSPAVFYYYALASLPPRHTLNNNADQDELASLRGFKYSNEKELEDALREWILEYRLWPRNRDFCRISIIHAMCVSAATLDRVAQNVHFIITTNDVTNFSTKAGTQPAASKKPPRPRLDPCEYNPPGRRGCPPV